MPAAPATSARSTRAQRRSRDCGTRIESALAGAFAGALGCALAACGERPPELARDEAALTPIAHALSPEVGAAHAGTTCAQPPDIAPVVLETNIDRYVSMQGDDERGDGSRLAPWRTVARALAPESEVVTPTGVERVPAIHLAPGTYIELVRIRRSLRLVRDDSEGLGGEATLRSPIAGPYVVTIAGEVTVVLEGLTIDGNKVRNPGIHVDCARVRLEGVNVRTPSPRGILIEGSPAFALLDCSVTNAGLLLYADYGLDIQSSRGIIDGLVAGDRFDHVVNVAGLATGLVISNSELTGSPIYYADGIRVQSAADVWLEHNAIIRPPEADRFDAGPAHNPPYAGIELATAGDAEKCVRVTGNVVTGFDAGIGVNMSGNALVAEANVFADNVRDQVRVVWHGGVEPLVDFGAGALGSAGENALFGGDFAFRHEGPFDVDAERDRWGGEPAERIWDASDAPELGVVQYR